MVSLYDILSILRLENLTLNVLQLTVQLLSCNPPTSWFSLTPFISKYAQFHSSISPSSGTNDKSCKVCLKIWKSAVCCESGPNSSLFQSKSAEISLYSYLQCRVYHLI